METINFKQIITEIFSGLKPVEFPWVIMTQIAIEGLITGFVSDFQLSPLLLFCVDFTGK